MIIRNRSGNIMVLVLVFIAIIGISFYSMIDYTLSQKRQAVHTNNILDLKFALDSTVDFVLFGIKQKYCFSDVLMSDANCNLQHNGSTERLIMSMEQVNFLLVAGKITGDQANQLRLQNIRRDLEISTVTPSHPLYTVLETLQKQKDLSDIRYLHVEIERNDSAFLPRSGNEVYLTVKVSLNKTSGDASVLLVNNQKLQVTSHVVIYPREIGSFALVVPRDLYLGSSGSNASFGDAHFYGVASKPQFGGKSGLVFLSPVFVNRNIVLNQGAYSPVTFADRVYMGEGKVLAGSAPYEPPTAGGEEGKYWRDITSFGGFLRGLENDGGQDAGLKAFIGNAVNTAPSESLMSQCIERNLSQSDLRKILNSALNVQLKEDSSGKFKYQLKLSNSEFEGQNIKTYSRLQNWGKGSFKFEYDEAFKKTIMDLTLKVGSRSANFSASKETEAVATVEVGSQQYENRLRNEYQQAKKDLEQALSDELMSSDEIQSKRAAEIAAKDKLDRYLYAVANPPKITIQTEPVKRKVRGTSNSKINFVITVENPPHLIDPDGGLINPEIYIKAFDSGYQEGRFIGNRSDAWRDNGQSFLENQNLKRVLNFTINSNSVKSSGDPVTNTQDEEDLADLCMNARDAFESQAFGMADANVSFASSTRTSWNFAGTGNETGENKKDPLVTSLQFDGNNARAGANNTRFQVRSIVGTCTIKDSADFITGFFACDKLVIEQRATPLRIIGTFIAGQVEIHPDAYSAGILWSSIYHPQAVTELRSEGILHRESNNGSCENGLQTPIWHPIPSIQEVTDRMSCNVISLRAKADPFQWTTVDPDCGLLQGQSNMTCKKRLVRFFVVEQAREGVR